jgi:hypothetical protein
LGTTSSINPALVNLLQNLSNAGSPLLSSSTAMAALQKAPASDIVQLSAEATQLEALQAILGQADASANAGPPTPESLLSSLYPTGGSTTPADALANLTQALANPPATSSKSNPSVAEALASYQSSLQSEEMQTLFG